MPKSNRAITSFRIGSILWLGSFLCSTSALGQETTNYGGQEQVSAGALDNLYYLISSSVLSNLPGVFLLLILSVFFSTINFYTDVPVGKRSLNGAGRYLAIWIGINYIFALLILFLIAPEEAGFLSQFSKTLFVYCMFATALPEIAANIRLQFGESTKSIDLYKYKSQISSVIASRVKSSVDHVRRKQLLALSYQYFDRLDDFLRQIDFLRGQEDLNDRDRENLSRLKEKIASLPPAGDAKRVFQLEKEHLALAPKLLAFFEDDISKFNGSPAAHLMNRLQPDLNIDEAQKLVEASVTSGVLFLFLCHWRTYRSRVSERSGIPLARLNTLYHNTRFVRRQRLFSGLSWSAAAILLPVIAVLLFANYEFRAKNQNSLAPITATSVSLDPPGGWPTGEESNIPLLVPALPAEGSTTTVGPL